MEALWFMAGYFSGISIVFLMLAIALKITGKKLIAVDSDR